MSKSLLALAFWLGDAVARMLPSTVAPAPASRLEQSSSSCVISDNDTNQQPCQQPDATVLNLILPASPDDKSEITKQKISIVTLKMNENNYCQECFLTLCFTVSYFLIQFFKMF